MLTESLLCDLRQHIHDLWNDLMTNEIALVDQIEDVINEFERNLEEKVTTFCETIQASIKSRSMSPVNKILKLNLTLFFVNRFAS